MFIGIVTTMAITGRSVCSVNIYCDNTGMYICSVSINCDSNDNNEEVNRKC